MQDRDMKRDDLRWLAAYLGSKLLNDGRAVVVGRTLMGARIYLTEPYDYSGWAKAW